MRLSELEAEFIKIIDERTHGPATMAEADGLFFLCPVCFKNNAGNVGTHAIICWRPRVPRNRDPKPGRWEFEGSGLDDLSLVAGSSSILLQGGCNAHFFIRRGHVEFT